MSEQAVEKNPVMLRPISLPTPIRICYWLL